MDQQQHRSPRSKRNDCSAAQNTALAICCHTDGVSPLCDAFL
jgi:hypothetical protein